MSISKETIRNAAKLYDTLEDEESKLIFAINYYIQLLMKINIGMIF